MAHFLLRPETDKLTTVDKQREDPLDLMMMTMMVNSAE